MNPDTKAINLAKNSRFLPKETRKYKISLARDIMNKIHFSIYLWEEVLARKAAERASKKRHKYPSNQRYWENVISSFEEFNK